MSGDPTLKVRFAGMDDNTGPLLGDVCHDIAGEMVDLWNEKHPRRAMRVIDATWATPEAEWVARGGGWS